MFAFQKLLTTSRSKKVYAYTGTLRIWRKLRMTSVQVRGWAQYILFRLHEQPTALSFAL